MADRYWVGGTGSWDATTTNWSATSGGAGGASVPTSADDVYFNSASNATAYVVTLAAAPICRSVSVAGPASGNVTIAGGIAWQIFGSLTIAATGVTWTNTSAITFAATTTGFTITTNGVSLPNIITLGGVGGEWTLGSALTTTANFIFNAGTFSTNNFSFTCASAFTSTGALTRTLNLGSSAVQVLLWNCLGSSNLTVNAGTSTITLTQAAGGFSGGGLTYYNVFKNNNGFFIGDAGNTFNALTNNTTTTGGTFVCQFGGNQTIGTLTVNGGTNATSRSTIQTTTALIGTQITLTVGSFVTNGFVDFRDINFQGAASPLTVATGGDAGNNANITFAAPKTVYWSLAAGGNYPSAAWATTSGGAASAANYPLPQDTAIIEDTGLNSGATINNLQNNLAKLDMSTRTLPMTFALAATNVFSYNDLILSSAVTITSTTGTFLFQGFNKTQTITSAGVTFDANFTVNNPSTTVTLADNLALGSAKQTTLTQGTLNVNGKNFTTGTVSSNNSFARSISYGGGTITVTGASWSTVGVNYTTSGSGTIDMTSASSKTFAGGNHSHPTLNQGGAGTLVITGANTFANMTNTVQPATITFPASTTTTVSNFNVNGTAGNLVTLNSSTPGTRFTLLKI